MPLASPSIEGQRIAALAVELLCGRDSAASLAAVRSGARRAINLRLAGIFRMGLRGNGQSEACSGGLAEDLVRAERAEVAADLSVSQRSREYLHALSAAGISPVVLKGRALAERLWPRPWMRPPGDLDLLLDDKALAPAVRALVHLGLRPRGGDAPGRWRPTLAGVDLAPTTTEDGVDLHTRLFRAVGSGIDTAEILSRARESEFLGVRVRLLDPADEVLYLLVHAAAHGTVHPKWLLDLHIAAIAYTPDVWLTAAERALASRTSRAFWAATRLLSGEARVPLEIARRLRPPPYARVILSRLVVTRFGPPWPTRPGLRAYALQGILEERVRERVVRLAGLIERLVSRLTRRFKNRDGRRSSAEVASHRWLEKAWRTRRSGLVWLTLRGSSMAPTLRDGDRLLVASFAAGEAPRKGDVVIAKLTGRLVAHRLVAQTPQGVLTRGDACVRDDPALEQDEILARVVAVDRSSSKSEVTHERARQQA
jgi:hypothetical protein